MGSAFTNFNVSIYLSSDDSSTSRKRRAITSTEGPFVASMNEDTSAGLATKSNMTLTGTVNIVLSRENCISMQKMCYVVASGTGASYEVAGGQTVLCADVSPYKNCDGKLIFCNNPNIVVISVSFIHRIPITDISTYLFFQVLQFKMGH